LADPSKIAPSTRKKALAEAWARRVEAKMDRGEFVDLKAAEQKTLGELRRLFTSHGRRRRQNALTLVEPAVCDLRPK
jgi:hypothetical protein